MKVLQVNNVDIYGRSFNGYDLMNYLNENKIYDVKQLVVSKFSKNENVIGLYKDKIGTEFEGRAFELEQSQLGVHSTLSATSYFVNKNIEYKSADIVHYHQVHNLHLNLKSFTEMAKTKPTVVSFHDPWFLTGRCVHPGKCEKWKSGCSNCEQLDTLFSFAEDNCEEFWKIKKDLLDNADIDIIVHSKFMLDMVKNSPYTKDKVVHLVNLGIDLKKYDFKKPKEKARKELGIEGDSIVLFFRAQDALKGTSYIVDALRDLRTDKKVVLLTCSEKGRLSEIDDMYKVIELGVIDQKKVITCFNACDIFLMPSLGESFGIMAVEAMASGKPVVVFDNTALPTVTFAPECGVLVKDRDSDDLREKIKLLIDNPEERERRGRLGKQLANEHYDIEQFYKQTAEVYEKAFERQKYKIGAKSEPIKDFDASDKEVKKLLIKLQKIASDLFPYDEFKSLSKTDFTVKSGKIDYSNENVRRAMVVFNNELSQKIENVDNSFYAMSTKGFRKLKIYQWLKRSVFLKKIMNKLQYIFRDKNFERYNNLLLQFKKLELQNIELEKKLELLIERIDKFDDK